MRGPSGAGASFIITPMRMLTNEEMLVRLQRRMAPGPHGCVLYTGTLDGRGYGRVWWGAKLLYAHRAHWLAAGRTVPAGLELDHACRNPTCVNLDHLRPVTHAANMRNLKQPRDRCKKGHQKKLSAKTGRYNCIVCSVDAVRRWRKAHPGGVVIRPTPGSRPFEPLVRPRLLKRRARPAA